MDIETPVVESRLIPNYREVSNDEPGLVLTDDGTIWLVNPDGTRIPLSGGGGGSFPTFYQLAEPGSPADGDTWMRPAGGYPDQYGVGAFRWDGSSWRMIAPVTLDVDGNVLGIIDVDDSGIVVMESYKAGGAGGSTIQVQSTRIQLITQDSYLTITEGQGVTIAGPSAGGTGLVIGANGGSDVLRADINGTDWFVVGGDIANGVKVALADTRAFSIGGFGGINGGGFNVNHEGAVTQFAGDVNQVQYTLNAPPGQNSDIAEWLVDNQLVARILGTGTVLLTPVASSGVNAIQACYDDGTAALTVGTDQAGVAISLLHEDDVFSVNSLLGQPFSIVAGAAHDHIAMGLPSSLMGFFGAAPVAQQTTPVTLGDVIALLQAYGLAA